MADPIFEDRRLAEIYDPLDPDRGDLEIYAAIVEEFGASRVLDVGCGTGTFACLLVARGVEVVGVDPAQASLEIARSKEFAERVRWVLGDVLGDVTALPPLQVELATMTGNVAQVFVADTEWGATLHGVRDALVPGGRFVLETRDPARKGWLEWNRAETYQVADIPGVGAVETWCDVTSVEEPLVSFRHTFVFASDRAVITSDSTLRFRSRVEVERSLESAGFVVDEVRDAPDRPGREFVFIASRG
ncbi:MAG: hypothetical protein QOF10_186 [Kribbellaceae bacterium]|nr:hypothetical protein [Kribbellaceae bacterium]